MGCWLGSCQVTGMTMESGIPAVAIPLLVCPDGTCSPIWLPFFGKCADGGTLMEIEECRFNGLLLEHLRSHAKVSANHQELIQKWYGVDAVPPEGAKFWIGPQVQYSLEGGKVLPIVSYIYKMENTLDKMIEEAEAAFKAAEKKHAKLDNAIVPFSKVLNSGIDIAEKRERLRALLELRGRAGSQPEKHSRPFQDLCKELPSGHVPMSDLLDMAIKDVYGSKAELSDMFACEIDDDGSCIAYIDSIRDKDESVVYTLKLCISKSFSISFWCDGTALHFNQAPLYAELLELGFWPPAKAREKTKSKK